MVSNLLNNTNYDTETSNYNNPYFNPYMNLYDIPFNNPYVNPRLIQQYENYANYYHHQQPPPPPPPPPYKSAVNLVMRKRTRSEERPFKRQHRDPPPYHRDEEIRFPNYIINQAFREVTKDIGSNYQEFTIKINKLKKGEIWSPNFSKTLDRNTGVNDFWSYKNIIDISNCEYYQNYPKKDVLKSEQFFKHIRWYCKVELKMETYVKIFTGDKKTDFHDVLRAVGRSLKDSDTNKNIMFIFSKNIK